MWERQKSGLCTTDFHNQMEYVCLGYLHASETPFANLSGLNSLATPIYPRLASNDAANQHPFRPQQFQHECVLAIRIVMPIALRSRMLQVQWSHILQSR
ncbi:hypothetical protein PS1_010172 [Malus domestica]